jgi:AcrR family transcriptional regulator
VVDFRDRKVTDAGLKELQELKNLQDLHLGNTQVTDVGLKQLRDFHQLKDLRLDGTNVTDTGLKELKDLKALEELYLERTRVTDAALKELSVLRMTRKRKSGFALLTIAVFLAMMHKKRNLCIHAMKTATQTMTPPATMRDRILDATERLLARFGYRKTTMEDIAREAGVGRRTIYLHFSRKEDLALSSIDRIVDRLKDHLRALAASAGPPVERLRQMLLHRVLFRFDSVRDYYQSLDEMFESLRPAYMARRRRYFDAEAEIFADVLREGQASDGFAFDDARATAHALLLATNALLPSALSTRELGKRKAVEEQTSRIIDLLVNGLCRPGSP